MCASRASVVAERQRLRAAGGVEAKVCVFAFVHTHACTCVGEYQRGVGGLLACQSVYMSVSVNTNCYVSARARVAHGVVVRVCLCAHA